MADSTGAADPAPAEHAAAETDWAAVLSKLDEQWSTAFSTGDVDALRTVDASDSAALAGDRALLQRYVDAGVSARGLRVERRRRVRGVGGRRSRRAARVVDRIEPYDIVDAGGAVLEPSPVEARQRGASRWCGPTRQTQRGGSRQWLGRNGISRRDRSASRSDVRVLEREASGLQDAGSTR